jgi:dimethylamine monooxygenase subunit A
MSSEPILQTRLPAFPWMDPRLSRLPGILPLELEDWLVADESLAGQMGLRDRLVATREAEVHALLPAAFDAASELYSMILKLLPKRGHRLGRDEVLRPDGVVVPLDPGRPLLTLGRLVQEDLCLMQEGTPLGFPGEHVLTGAILCFPASWSLSEKIGRPLLRIHDPVPPYDEEIARRVQRLFDAIRPERPLWRMNAHPYQFADLFHPRREGDPRPPPAAPAPYLRCERQCLVRLPRSEAVVFSIHTYVVVMEALPAEARAALEARATA